jgi:L-threonylcarbamoyladenylate synthase
MEMGQCIHEEKMNCTYEEAVTRLNAGKTIIYPTETFYALGCVATNEDAVKQIFELKGREYAITLPILISDWEMAHAYLYLDENTLRLARIFWPGSLSIVIKVRSSISTLACDEFNCSAVRMTPHPIAKKLCLDVGAPLVSSSANLSGSYPVSRPEKLDPKLTRSIPVLKGKPWPQGKLPSTLVEMKGAHALKILRHGAVSASQLVQAGFDLIE